MKKFIYLLGMFFFLINANHVHGQCGKYLVFNNAPWGQQGDQNAMNTVFGAGGWTQASYNTNPNTIFSSSNCFVMMDGSEVGNAIPLNNFLAVNHALIENWVTAGGRLFINAAPNEGGNINCGFNGTIINYSAGPYSQNVAAVNAGDAIFQGPYLPMATSFSGGYFAHAGIVGSGLTNLLLGNTPSPTGTVVLAYKKWGSGVVFFGTATQPAFWSPQPQSFNLWYNIFSYTNTITTVSASCSVSTTSFCTAQLAPVIVNYTTSGVFNAGNNFTAQLSDASGSFLSPVNIGTVTATASGTINASIPAGTTSGSGYRIRIISSNPVSTGINNGTNIQLNAGVIPTVSIAANQVNNICSGTNISFTATAINGGPAPVYQWKKNGNNTGTNSNIYSDATLVQNDIVTCVVTSNLGCVAPLQVTSNSIIFNVYPIPVAGITNNTGTTILTCNTTSVSVTATGGDFYQWDHSLGSNPTINITAPGTYTVLVISSEGCTVQQSITITQNNIIPATPVNISGPSPVCGGGTYTYSVASVANATYYRWIAPVNSTIISGQGTVSIQVQFNNTSGSGSLTVQSENNGCTNNTAKVLLVSYTATYTPQINITANPAGAVCPGTYVTFTTTANPVEINGSYQWFKNNIAVGTNSNIYTETSWTNGDIVKCVLTSNAPCLFTSTATSNNIIMAINTASFAGITNNTNTTLLNCTTTSINLTATGGASYSWDNGLGNGASKIITAAGTYTVTVTSAQGCVSQASIIITQNLAVPATPVTVSGLTNVCPYVGSNTQLTYAVAPDPVALSYQWVVPPTVTLLSGQGTNSITITIGAGFTASANKLFKVRAVSDCGSSADKIFYLLAQLPNTANPIIASATNLCTILNTANTITYTIPKVTAATSYIWTAQAGSTVITHPNGAGINDTTVQVRFGSGFTSSPISVQSVNDCGTSGTRSYNIVRSNPSVPGLISGPINACANSAPGGVAATYLISDVANAISYNWVIPSGAIGFTGQGTTTISFIYPAGFSSGSVSVTATNGCGTSAVRTLLVSKFNPATPSVIDVIQEQPCPGRIYSYSLASMPANATSVQWSIPSATGVVLISGQGTSSILVSYPDAAVQGVVTAQSVNNCGVSSVRQSAVRLPACPPASFAGKTAQTQSNNTNPKQRTSLVFDVNVFPNPSTTGFNVLVKTLEKQKATVNLFDVQGKKIQTFILMANEIMNLGQELKPGIYMLEVTEGHNRSIKKLVKQ